LSAPESTKAVGAAIVDARKDANIVGIDKEKTMVGYSDGALDLVDKASKLAALSNVLDKITRDGMSSRPRFGHSWIYASAFALMLVASAVMFVRWRAAHEAPQDLTSITPITGNSASNQAPESASSHQSKGFSPNATSRWNLLGRLRKFS